MSWHPTSPTDCKEILLLPQGTWRWGSVLADASGHTHPPSALCQMHETWWDPSSRYCCSDLHTRDKVAPKNSHHILCSPVIHGPHASSHHTWNMNSVVGGAPQWTEQHQNWWSSCEALPMNFLYSDSCCSGHCDLGYAFRWDGRLLVTSGMKQILFCKPPWSTREKKSQIRTLPHSKTETQARKIAAEVQT
jgi:hypothetical protein